MPGADNVPMDPPVRRDREIAYSNWCLSITVTASDGYRMQRLSIDLNDGWSQNDSLGAVEALGITAASLIKAVEASDIAVYGGSAVDGFREAYQDSEPSVPSSVGDRYPVLTG